MEDSEKFAEVNSDFSNDTGDFTNSKKSKKTKNDNAPQEEISMTESCFEWLHALIVAIIVVVLLLTFVFRLVDVDGKSMMNTLHDNDKVIVTNFLYEPVDGDIVVISHGQEYEKPIIKRVIATAGQTLQIDFNKGQVIVDGVVLDEPYINDLTTLEGDLEIPSVIPEGYAFVMGDNRLHSLDSRFHQVGLIDEKNIIGKAELVIFPFDRITSLM
ncbi:MAG TPA: signal peptidase I [Clostridiales bacterium]|nr:signal peptidase I [Clostridiales bacterium]